MKIHFIIFFICSVLLIGCHSEEDSHPDVSDIPVAFETYRIDRELMSADTNNILEVVHRYPAFMEIYLNHILNIGKDSATFLKGFITDEHISEIYQETEQLYAEFDPIAEDFHRAFQFYKFYFPDRQVPNLYTYISEYGLQRFIFVDEKGRDGLGLGLDLFLGGNYPYSQYVPNNPAFSQYLTRSFDKDHIIRKGMEVLVDDLISQNEGVNLLQKMIHNGKKLYILDKLLPSEPDSIIMEYTSDQMDWVEDNQVEMWAYLLKEDLFYETDINKINKLVNPSPNSPGMPKEAPGRTANYLGWKIVEAYMKRNPNVTLENLILEQNAEKILKNSKYKPVK